MFRDLSEKGQTMAKKFAQKCIGSTESLRTRWPLFEAWRRQFKVGPVKAKGKPIQNGNAPSAPIGEEESTKEHVKSHVLPESTDNVEEEILPREKKGVEIEIESPSVQESRHRSFQVQFDSLASASASSCSFLKEGGGLGTMLFFHFLSNFLESLLPIPSSISLSRLTVSILAIVLRILPNSLDLNSLRADF